ncbi:MAG: hypothetical protein K6G06_04275 [Butyrivibrio sp.]|nr:hypothetical protein [Butyrivibrio sp.]
MKHTNTLGDVIKKVLAFVLVLAIAVTFSQPLSVEAKKKAKANKVTLAKQGLSTDIEVIKSVSKELKAGKNAVTVKRLGGGMFSTYEGYAKFVAPAAKTYTLKFSNLKAKGRTKSVLGDVSGYTIKGQTIKSLKLGPVKNMYNAQLGTKNVSNYKKTFTSKVTLEEGETLYLLYSFSGQSKNKSVSLETTIK